MEKDWNDLLPPIRPALTVPFFIMSSATIFAVIRAVAHTSAMIIFIPTSIPIPFISTPASTATSSVIPVPVPVAILIPEKMFCKTQAHLQAYRMESICMSNTIPSNCLYEPKTSTI